jgi:hypothetical protein
VIVLIVIVAFLALGNAAFYWIYYRETKADRLEARLDAEVKVDRARRNLQTDIVCNQIKRDGLQLRHELRDQMRKVED